MPVSRTSPAFIGSRTAFVRIFRSKRKALGLSQKRVAECCGIDVKRLQEIEAGNRHVTLTMAVDLADQVGLRFTLANERRGAKPDWLVDDGCSVGLWLVPKGRRRWPPVRRWKPGERPRFAGSLLVQAVAR